MPTTRRESLINALIEQELASLGWQEFSPEIPVDATPMEALKLAREKLIEEYSAIALADLESLYSIFIVEKDDVSDQPEIVNISKAA